MNVQIRQINHERHLKTSVIKILTTIGSIISIGFGVWHFYPQGSQNSLVQFSMLFVFAFVCCCYAISLFLQSNQSKLRIGFLPPSLNSGTIDF